MTNIGGLEQSGGCLEKLKVVVFLVKRVSFIYLCEQMLLIYAMINSSSLCTSADFFLHLFRNYVYYHFIFPKINRRGSGGGRFKVFQKLISEGG